MPLHKPSHHRLPSPLVASLVRAEHVDALLLPWVPDATDRAFVVRCMLAEGPIHHRGASYALLRLLGLVQAALGPPPAAPSEDGVPVPLRLSPDMEVQDEEHHYPLCIPTAVLARLAEPGSLEMSALIDCLTDGPPHHALANAAMLCLLEGILQRVEALDR